MGMEIAGDGKSNVVQNIVLDAGNSSAVNTRARPEHGYHRYLEAYMVTLRLTYPNGRSEIVHLERAVRLGVCAHCNNQIEEDVVPNKKHCSDSHRVMAAQSRRIIKDCHAAFTFIG